MYLDMHAVSPGSEFALNLSKSSIKGPVTYVAPAINISTVLARAIADNAATSRIVVIAITETRMTRFLEVKHMMLGVKRKATIVQAMRARATVVIEDPENIWTFGSLDII